MISSNVISDEYKENEKNDDKKCVENGAIEVKSAIAPNLPKKINIPKITLPKLSFSRVTTPTKKRVIEREAKEDKTGEKNEETPVEKKVKAIERKEIVKLTDCEDAAKRDIKSLLFDTKNLEERVLNLQNRLQDELTELKIMETKVDLFSAQITDIFNPLLEMKLRIARDVLSKEKTNTTTIQPPQNIDST